MKVLVLAIRGPKFVKVWENVEDLMCLMPFSDCLCHVLFRRCPPLSLENVDKQQK